MLTKFLKPQDHMLCSWPQENGEIKDSELHRTNNLYAKSPKPITETTLTHFNALKGIKFHRMKSKCLESLCVTQSFFNNMAFRHVKSLQNDPVIF